MIMRDKSPLVRVVECEHFANHIRLKAVALGEPLHALIAVCQEVFWPHARPTDHRLPGEPPRHRLDGRAFHPIDLHGPQFSLPHASRTGPGDVISLRRSSSVRSPKSNISRASFRGPAKKLGIPRIFAGLAAARSAIFMLLHVCPMV